MSHPARISCDNDPSTEKCNSQHHILQEPTYFLRTTKAVAKLYRCADSLEPLLVKYMYVPFATIACTGSYEECHKNARYHIVYNE